MTSGFNIVGLHVDYVRLDPLFQVEKLNDSDIRVHSPVFCQVTGGWVGLFCDPYVEGVLNAGELRANERPRPLVTESA